MVALAGVRLETAGTLVVAQGTAGDVEGSASVASLDGRSFDEDVGAGAAR